MSRTLILAPFSQTHLNRLCRFVEVSHESWMNTQQLYDPNQLAQRINDNDISILVVEADFVFDETLQEAKSLRFVGVCRTSTHHIDVESATQHGVVIVILPRETPRL